MITKSTFTDAGFLTIVITCSARSPSGDAYSASASVSVPSLLTKFPSSVLTVSYTHLTLPTN